MSKTIEEDFSHERGCLDCKWVTYEDDGARGLGEVVLCDCPHSSQYRSGVGMGFWCNWLNRELNSVRYIQEEVNET